MFEKRIDLMEYIDVDSEEEARQIAEGVWKTMANYAMEIVRITLRYAHELPDEMVEELTALSLRQQGFIGEFIDIERLMNDIEAAIEAEMEEDEDGATA